MGSDRANGPVDLEQQNSLPAASTARLDELAQSLRPVVETQPAPSADDSAYLNEMAETERLSIQALIHEAWTREMARKRGFAFRISAQDQRILELVLSAMRGIPDKDVAR